MNFGERQDDFFRQSGKPNLLFGNLELRSGKPELRAGKPTLRPPEPRPAWVSALTKGRSLDKLAPVVGAKPDLRVISAFNLPGLYFPFDYFASFSHRRIMNRIVAVVFCILARQLSAQLSRSCTFRRLPTVTRAVVLCGGQFSS